MRKRLFLGLGGIVVASFLAFVAPGSSEAWADSKGDALVKKTDEALNRFKTFEFHYDLDTTEPGKETRHMKVRVRQKGKKQLTEILEPADARMRVLILSDTQMYVYLPQYRKMRRIASHVTDQDFMGTAFNATDMSLMRYADDYDAKILSEDDKSATLELTRKDGADAAYAKIELKVDKEKWLPTDMKYFNDAGKHIKSETRRDYVCVKNVCQPKKMTMVNHVKGGLSSTLKLTAHKIDSAIDDDVFSKRALQE